MQYEKYLEMVMKSKAILDLVTENNEGLTLRPLEAMIANKKLITNFKGIKNLDLYNANNVFIIDEDNMNDMGIFLKTQIDPISELVKKSYCEKEWLLRFLNQPN